MLLSLLKILFFFAVVLAIALGATQLAQNGQPLRLEFNGTEYLLGPLQLVVVALVVMVLAWVAFKLLGVLFAFLRFLAGDDTAISRHFTRSRERKGYEALGEGMLAVAAGEGRLAQEKAAKAEKYLDRPHLTNLLAAQAAEVAGDSARAGQVYRKLLEDDRTRFVGVRGLMRQKLAEGDTTAALQLAQKAYAMKPRHGEVQNALMDLELKAGDWKGARTVLKDKRKQGEIPQDVHLRRDAVLALQEAREVLKHGNSISAREAAISANRASPDLIPAAVLAARSYLDQKDYRNASRVLEKTWSVRPHPDIAAAYAEIVPDETPAARLKRFETLMRKNPDAEETRLLRAELLLSAEDFPGARRALGDLAEVHPTVRTLSIMAAVERGQGADDAVVRGWLARALTASRGPQWVCDTCQNVMPDWAPVCDKCSGFDTLSWREPDHRPATGAAAGAEMLPLLVGPRPKPARVDPEDETDAEKPAPRVREAPEPAAAAAPAVEPKAKPDPTSAPPRNDVPPAAPREAAAHAAQPAVTRPESRPPGSSTTDITPPADTDPGGRGRPRGSRIEVPLTAPGMVPREDEYIEIAPSATVTTPDPEPHPIRSAEFDVPAREAENRAERERSQTGRLRKS